MLQAYFDATRIHGLERGLKYLDTTEAFFWVPPGYQERIPYDSVVAFIKRIAPAVAQVDNRWNDLHIQLLGKDEAVFTGEVSSTATGHDGVQRTTLLLETGVARRGDDGKWRLLCGQTRTK